MKILMVCLGNICRSPLAEGILQHKANEAGLNWQVDSAGTNGYHNGEAPHPLSQKIAKQNGIDISNQKSRKLTQDDFDQFDHLYAMANDVLSDMMVIGGKKFDSSKSTLLLETTFPGLNKDVPDPWYSGEDAYVRTYELIEKACDAIIADYLQKNATA